MMLNLNKGEIYRITIYVNLIWIFMAQKKPARIKVESAVVVDEKGVLELELRQRFLPNGKNVPNDPSIRAIQQFLRFTDAIVSGKNTAGGSFFTWANREKEENQEKYRDVYSNVMKIKEPVYKIKCILEDASSLDFQQLEKISYYLMDFVEVLPISVYALLDDPAIKEDQSNFMRSVGHNVGFRDFILKQFIKDLKKSTYNNLIERLNGVVKRGNDPLSYSLY